MIGGVFVLGHKSAAPTASAAARLGRLLSQERCFALHPRTETWPRQDRGHISVDSAMPRMIARAAHVRQIREGAGDRDVTKRDPPADEKLSRLRHHSFQVVEQRWQLLTLGVARRFLVTRFAEEPRKDQPIIEHLASAGRKYGI